MNIRTLIPLVIAGIILLAAGLLYGVGYYMLTQLTAKVADTERKEATKSHELERATRAHSALSSLADEEAALDQYTIAKADIVPFLEQLQSSGTAVGSRVEVLSVGDQPDKTHTRVSVSLSISGSFDSIMRTLGSIDYAPYDIVLTNASISGNNSNDAAVTAWTALATYSVAVRTPIATKP